MCFLPGTIRPSAGRRRYLRQRPPAGGAEFGQLGFDVHGDDAEEVDVLAVRRGDVGQELSGMAAVPEAPHALSITHPQAVNEAI
jgi:hypothetical protein